MPAPPAPGGGAAPLHHRFDSTRNLEYAIFWIDLLTDAERYNGTLIPDEPN
ncbi:MAG: hypothetical protein AAF726_13630 [Planctomycetota bacterium]